MLVPKLLLTPIKIRIFGPKTAIFCSKYAFLDILSRLVGWLVSGCGRRLNLVRHLFTLKWAFQCLVIFLFASSFSPVLLFAILWVRILILNFYLDFSWCVRYIIIFVCFKVPLQLPTRKGAQGKRISVRVFPWLWLYPTVVRPYVSLQVARVTACIVTLLT